MHFIDRCDHEGECLFVAGWFFKIGAAVKQVCYRDEFVTRELEGYGKPSLDIAAIHDKSHTHSRFEFAIEGGSLSGRIVFNLDDGTSEGIRLNVGEQGKRIASLKHQIHDGIYRGKFVLDQADGVQSVALSKGAALDGEAEPVEEFQQTRSAEGVLVEVVSPCQSDWTSDNLCLHFQLESGEWIQFDNVPSTSRQSDPAHRISSRFIEWVNAQQDSLDVLEIGSRARSGINRRHQINARHNYIGIDVREGENVDKVCDAHVLSETIEKDSIDVVVSYSVFEHIAMPWKVVLEMNKVMRVGGRCMLHVPHSWPMHEAPFDFWRFSDDSWRALFNESTGFKIIESACGEPSIIRPEIQMEAVSGLETAFAYLCAVVVAEKTHETKLRWDVPTEHVYAGNYPH